MFIYLIKQIYVIIGWLVCGAADRAKALTILYKPPFGALFWQSGLYSENFKSRLLYLSFTQG